ncbi:hypothetical protein Unana1_05580 [Umbelopsis nana]
MSDDPPGNLMLLEGAEVELQESVHGSTSAAVETDPAENGDHSSNYTKSTTFENAVNVVAVFVSRFDVHRGNIIEWQYPDDIELGGVEYQSICSGLHSISHDTIGLTHGRRFFKRGANFGVSAFENKAVNENTEERGARMMAVGCLVVPTPDTGSCGQVWHHVDFLRTQVK